MQQGLRDVLVALITAIVLGVGAYFYIARGNKIEIQTLDKSITKIESESYELKREVHANEKNIESLKVNLRNLEQQYHFLNNDVTEANKKITESSIETRDLLINLLNKKS